MAIELVHRPNLRAIVRRLGVNLLFANLIPGALFYLCFVAMNVWLAVLTDENSSDGSRISPRRAAAVSIRYD